MSFSRALQAGVQLCEQHMQSTGCPPAAVATWLEFLRERGGPLRKDDWLLSVALLQEACEGCAPSSPPIAFADDGAPPAFFARPSWHVSLGKYRARLAARVLDDQA